MIANDNIPAWFTESVAVFSCLDLILKQAFITSKGLLLSNRSLFGRPSHSPSFSITQGKLHYGNNEYLCREIQILNRRSFLYRKGLEG